jgi:hypothetical protein
VIMEFKGHHSFRVYAISMFLIVIAASFAECGMTISGNVTLSSVSFVGGPVALSGATASSATIPIIQASSGTINSFMVTGTTVSDNAPNGRLGEYIETNGTVLNISTGTAYYDLTSINLSAGDWDVSACGGVIDTVNFARFFLLAITTTPGNNNAGITTANSVQDNDQFILDPADASCISPYRMTFATTTAVYLKYQYGTFNMHALPSVQGRISARRVR